MKLAYVTFADNRYKPTRDRAKKEVQALGIFDRIYAFSEDDFDLPFKDVFYGEHRDKMFAFGYYSWAPWACKHALDQIEDNDILFYSDAGNTINPNGKKRLLEWIEMVSHDDNDILGIVHEQYKEYEYTKEDVFHYFGIDKNDIIRKTGQFFVGALVIRKTESSSDLINQWFEVGSMRLDLIDETALLQNDPRFVAFRYDQSLISVLLKKYDKVVTVDYSEVCLSGRSTKGLENAPFWAFRTKEITPWAKIEMLPKRIVNRICRLFGLKVVYRYKV